MAKEKMVLLNLVGSLDEEHALLEKLIVSGKIHLMTSYAGVYNNSYIIHQYETMVPHDQIHLEEHDFSGEYDYETLQKLIDEIREDLGEKETTCLFNEIQDYPIEEAKKDLEILKECVAQKVEEIHEYTAQKQQLIKFGNVARAIKKESIDLDALNRLKYFDYKIGLLPHESKKNIKKNYENISAIVMNVGNLLDIQEDIYLVLYPKEFDEEIENLLKSLNWEDIVIPEGVGGDICKMADEIETRVEEITKKIEHLDLEVCEDKEWKKNLLRKIYLRIKLEKKIEEVKMQLSHGDNLFVLNAWIPKKDKDELEKSLQEVTNEFVILTKTAEEIGIEAGAPTKLKNNRFFEPFEMIVKLYGLPSYNEIDPTPFLGLTFCLMFGIMFGDIGQGLIYFLAGVYLSRKNKTAGGILKRLGSFSIAFGFVYGSLFGLEQHELPWLPSIIGAPLDPNNIPLILMMGVVFGVVVLSVSFILGIINSYKVGDIEEAIFGKNGVVGYIFFLGLVITALALVGVIDLAVKVPLIVMAISLVIMIFKLPLTHLVTGHTPYMPKDKGSYFTESCFEGVETILATLSNTISFIRVGAFALNHAGLFMAFLVMSQMTSNIALKILILVLGNILILTLEGLIVFIQGLRLQYYEMFNKYFKGDGIEYNPVKID